MLIPLARMAIGPNWPLGRMYVCTLRGRAVSFPLVLEGISPPTNHGADRRRRPARPRQARHGLTRVQVSLGKQLLIHHHRENNKNTKKRNIFSLPEIKIINP